MPDSTLSTLAQIKIKVRRLTRSISDQQLSDDELTRYINTFVLYDFPEHLRLFNLHTTFEFFTQPYIETYDTNTTDTTSPLYNFKNKYLTVNPPAYIAGYQAVYGQDKTQFFGMYPMINAIASIGTAGDGVTTTFSGNINTNQSNNISNANQGSLILQGNVLFSSIDTNGNSLALVDYPFTSTTGALGLVGVPETIPSFYGEINYITGNFTLTFSAAPASGATINSQTVTVQPTLPQSILFYDGKFTLRPVPDQAYRITIEAFKRPDELLANSQEPGLAEYWQLISYGAAKKILQDRMDLESVALIEPEFRAQMLLIQRRTLVQQSNQRASTIYTDQVGAAGAYGPGLFSGGGQS